MHVSKDQLQRKAPMANQAFWILSLIISHENEPKSQLVLAADVRCVCAPFNRMPEYIPPPPPHPTTGCDEGEMAGVRSQIYPKTSPGTENKESINPTSGEGISFTNCTTLAIESSRYMRRSLCGLALINALHSCYTHTTVKHPTPV